MKFKNFKRFSFILTIILLIGVVTACSPKDIKEPDLEGKEPTIESTDFPKTIVDGFGNKVIIESKPEKIVSSAPNNTEILFELGLGENVVGVSTADDYPAEALEKDQVATYEGLNLEKIIELETDLVVYFGNMIEKNPDDYKRLEEAGISVISYEPESIEEVIETIKSIGMATGNEEKAKEVTDKMNEDKEKLLEKIKSVEKKKVFYEVWGDPLLTAGPGSFMNEMITIAGGENIALDAESAYPQYDLESLVENDPEIYIVSDGDPDLTVESIKSRPGYKDITAVKNDKVYLVDANLVSRPGPRIIEGLELIAKTIYPEQFK